MIKHHRTTSAAYRILSALAASILIGSLAIAATASVRAAEEEDEEETVSLQPGDQVTVTRGDFIVSREQSPDLYLPKQEYLFFEYDNAVLASIEVRRGDMVEEGDLLMTFERQEDVAASESRRIELERLRANVAAETENMQNQIKDLQAELKAETDTTRRAILNIDIQIATENLRWQQSSNQRRIETLEEADRQAAEDLAVTELRAPFAGEITDLTSRKIGDRLNAWEYMGRLTGQEPLLLQVNNTYGEFRLGETVSVTHGTARDRIEIQAKVVADHTLLGPELVASTAWLALEGISARDAIQAINPKVTVHQQQIEDVLMLPRQAVIRQNQDFYVNLSTDSGIVRRYVQVGNWNSKDYWIVDGLEEGDTVVIE